MSIRIIFLALVFLLPLAGCDLLGGEDEDGALRYGAATPIGNGVARTFVRLGEGGDPEAIGVILTKEALSGLPAHGDHSTNSFVLRLPTAAAPFDHVGFDWNPHGHEPEGLFTLPHFDVHFYMETEAERATWLPSDPQWEAKVAQAPASKYVPAGYVPTPGGVPMMGAHWIDTADPTYAPGGSFGEVLLWGSYDGRVVFAEPMITKTFLEALPAHGDHIETLAQPQAWARSGYYPTRYSVRYDADQQEYVIALEGLTYRSAS